MKIATYSIVASLVLTTLLGCSEQSHDQELTTTDPQRQQQEQIQTQQLPETLAIEAAKPEVLGQVSKAQQEVAIRAEMADSSVVLSKRAKVMAPAMAPATTAHFQAMPIMEPPVQLEDRDNYLENQSNSVQQVSHNPLSTFSIDVDTGSYANVRSQLNMGRKPPEDAVREEAFINYFDYDYPAPKNKNQPFSVYSEVAPAPWHADRQLLRIALKGYEVPTDQRKASNLVFLVDVSGSMNQPNKLPLLVQSLSLLTKQLNESDKVSLVTYAGKASVVLEPTEGDNKQAILDALRSLSAGGGTYGESGINLAYQQAKQAFIKDGVNRVILATDGDFNVGVTSIDALKKLIETQRKQGISLTTLGFGRGNYNDALMEQLANIGDGNHAYIDTLHEAKKVLLRQMSGTLQTIASDVKIQIEFNPQTVKEYRLIGYQNRLLKDEDFNNDSVDAGEIGAGHSVTALYELTLTGQPGQVDELRYQQKAVPVSEGDHQGELALVKVRHKLPGANDSSLMTQVVKASSSLEKFEQASLDFRFAASAAAFAQKLKGNHYLDDLSYEQIADIARESRGSDPYNYRGEFISLVEIAQSI